MSDVATQVPLVDYLILGDEPHLQASECTACGARFFDRRNACAACFNTEFTTVDIPTEGVLTSFTIVAHAAPGIDVPFVADNIRYFPDQATRAKMFAQTRRELEQRKLPYVTVTGSRYVRLKTAVDAITSRFPEVVTP